ncbi:hypothetical protein JCM8547_002215 [Rhodosporidiobolus lusitaniae]
MPPKRALVSFGVDVDAVCGWIGSYGGEDSPNDITRGMFAGEVGTPRLLRMFQKYGLKTTWFVPVHSLLTFPKEMAAVRDAGHEISMHGWAHENMTACTLEQQTEIVDDCIKQFTEFLGKPPKGWCSCWWQSSKEIDALLLARGVAYDHSSQAHDCQPHWSRNHSWTKIDYKQKSATSWMKPLVKGEETDLLQIPANWYLDDLPPHMFMSNAKHTHGFVDVDVTLKLWKKHFEYFYREEEWFVFPLTIHPDVSGRPHVLLMLEELIEWLKTFDGVEFVTMEQINDEFRARDPGPGAKKE